MFYSPTENIWVLVAMSDAKGVIRISPNAGFPGLIKNRIPIVEKIVEIAQREISPEIKAIDLHYWHQFAENLSMSDGIQRTLFVAQLKNSYLAPESWITFPEYLRSLPADRNRLVWLKAWQVFAAGFRDDCRVFETDDIEKWTESD